MQSSYDSVKEYLAACRPIVTGGGMPIAPRTEEERVAVVQEFPGLTFRYRKNQPDGKAIGGK